MIEVEIGVKSFFNSSVLNNSGAPMSRTRLEKISSNIFSDQHLKSHSEIISFNDFTYKHDIEYTLLKMAETIGCKDLESAIIYLKLPVERLLILPKADIKQTNEWGVHKLLRNALILSKCNKAYYTPDAPMIFSKNRLDRSIELIKINLNSYYGME
jgi:hypothetical protein